MKFKPAPDRIAIKVHEAPEFSRGGLVVPDAYRKDPETATVLAIGENITHVKVGDEIHYTNGIDIEVKGEKVRIIKEENLLGVVQ